MVQHTVLIGDTVASRVGSAHPGDQQYAVLQGGAASFVAQQLDNRLREHLKLRNNLLNEGTTGLSASLSRPLLCLFDRNFELSVVSWPLQTTAPAAPVAAHMHQLLLRIFDDC